MIDLNFKFFRISFSVFVTMLILGIISWQTMPREEDPRLKKRFGNIQVIYPGATAEEIHRLVVGPLDDELSKIDEVKKADALSRAEFAFIDLELKSSVDTDIEINRAWDEVENAMEKAASDFPAGVKRPELDRSVLDQDAIVIAITGGESIHHQISTLHDLESKLLATPLVASINRLAEPGETIRINVDEEKLEKLGVSFFELAQTLRQANEKVSSGGIQFSSKKLTLKTNSSFSSIEDIKSFSIALSNGESVRVDQLARVEKTIQEPRELLFRLNGKEGLGIGIVPQENIDLISFGENVKSTLKSFDSQKYGTQVDIVSFQPENVKTRLSELSGSLLLGIVIIGVALVFLIGFRMGLIASVLVPSIALASLAVFAVSGGVLHQISIAAFVVSLGLLVDNVIVIMEAVQTAIDGGHSPLQAAKNTVRELALPLTAATGTTVASFVPMLGASGTTADFTRTIPLVVVITLVVSFIVALFITPIISKSVLKSGNSLDWSKAQGLFSRFANFVIARPKVMVAVTIVTVSFSMAFFPQLKQQFFPSADRNQLVVDIKLPEGTHYSKTDLVASKVEDFLMNQDSIKQVASFVGEGTPRFFYNLNRAPKSPHVAQMIIRFESAPKAVEEKQQIQQKLDDLVPEALVIVRGLNQGPPTNAPIEYRISSTKIEDLNEGKDLLIGALRDTAGTTKVRSTLGIGAPVIKFTVDDINASQFGVTRSVVGSALFSRTRGLEIGAYRFGNETFPIILGNESLEKYTLNELSDIQILQTRTKSLKLNQLVKTSLEFEPSVIQSSKGTYYTQVLSELSPGTGFNHVVSRISQKLNEDDRFSKYNIAIDGVAAESDEANTAIFKVLPLGLLLLLISLLIQFNSFKKVFVVFGAVLPIWIGIVPGLLITGQPFGFFSLLGLLALVGIVVNNGILIVDQIDVGIKNGLTQKSAVQQAVIRRLRPIILTTVTTVLGLLPLGFTSATLWPPFAWTMIFGLMASMVFTPIIVPSLYLIFIREKKVEAPKESSVLKPMASLTMGVLFVLIPLSPKAETVNFESLTNFIESHPVVRSENKLTDERLAEKKRIRSQALLPTVQATARKVFRDRELEFQTPVGNFGGTGLEQSSADLTLIQPIYRPGKLDGESQALDFEIKAQRLSKQRKSEAVYRDIVSTFAKQLEIKVIRDSLVSYIKKLKRQRSEIVRLQNLGRVTSVDRLKVDLAISEGESTLYRVEETYKAMKISLASALGKTGQYTALEIKSFEAWKQKNISFKEVVPDERADIMRLASQIKALDSRKKSINRSYLPSVSIVGNTRWEDPTAFSESQSSFVGIQAQWNIYGAHEREFQKQKIESLKNSLIAGKRAMELGAYREVSISMASLSSLIDEYPRRKKDFSQAQKVVQLEEKRYLQGKASLNDLLEAEFLLQQKTEELQSLPYKIMAAWSKVRYSLGK